MQALTTAEAAQSRARNIELRVEAEEYLTNTHKAHLTPEQIQLEFEPLLEDYDATCEELSTRLKDCFSSLDRNTLIAVMSSGDDISKADADRLVSQVERTRKAVAAASLWLFAFALVSAIASAGAGALGVIDRSSAIAFFF